MLQQPQHRHLPGRQREVRRDMRGAAHPALEQGKPQQGGGCAWLVDARGVGHGGVQEQAVHVVARIVVLLYVALAALQRVCAPAPPSPQLDQSCD